MSTRATKVFSSRANEDSLAFADGLTKREYGVSYGQYCGTLLLDSIQATGRLPMIETSPSALKKKQAALSFIKGFPSKTKDPAIGKMPDDQIRDLIASRYDQ